VQRPSRFSRFRIFAHFVYFAFRISHFRTFRVFAHLVYFTFHISHFTFHISHFTFHISAHFAFSAYPALFAFLRISRISHFAFSAYFAHFAFPRISCISHSHIFHASTCATTRLPGIHRILFACPVLILQGPLVRISLGFTCIISHMSLHSHLCPFISLCVYITSPLYV